jgi:hypothetical protein
MNGTYLFLNEIAESPLQCCVCKGQSSGAHRCLQCNNPVHAICGENPNGLEGFGVPVVCNICQTSGKNGENSQCIIAVQNNSCFIESFLQ